MLPVRERQIAISRLTETFLTKVLFVEVPLQCCLLEKGGGKCQRDRQRHSMEVDVEQKTAAEASQGSSSSSSNVNNNNNNGHLKGDATDEHEEEEGGRMRRMRMRGGGLSKWRLFRKAFLFLVVIFLFTGFVLQVSRESCPTNTDCVHLVMGCPNARAGEKIVGKMTPRAT